MRRVSVPCMCYQLNIICRGKSVKEKTAVVRMGVTRGGTLTVSSVGTSDPS